MTLKKYFKYAVNGFLLLAILSSCSEEKFPPKPNIIILQADDLGYSDLGIHGNPYVDTPNLDKLAKESVQFRQFYVTPVCATTRAALLTGKHHLKTGVSHVHGGKDFLHLSEKTLADRLKTAGYQTGMWGKWHSGKTNGYYPWQRGFDEAFMAGLYQFTDNKGLLNGKPVQHQGWTPEVLTDYAIDFISKNKEKPFFAYVPYLTCHGPLKAKSELKAKYLERVPEGLATLYAMVELMDSQIGRLLRHLDDLDLAENTIVIFLSDNGPAVNHRDLTEEDRQIRYVNNLRGHKGNIWENGIKSPFFFRWKGSLEPSIEDKLADVTDITPTLLEMAGGGLDSSFDGISLFAYLQGKEKSFEGKVTFLYAHKAWQPSDKAWSPEGVYNEYEPITLENRDTLLSLEKQVIGIRNQRYKLLLNASRRETEAPFYSGYALYDILNDPTESKNIFLERSDIAEGLIQKLKLKYQENFAYENAFAVPKFLIESNKGAQKVLAYAPKKIVGDPVNAFNYLGTWRKAGNAAAYKIDVADAGQYQVFLNASIDQGEASFVLKTQTEQKEIIIKADEEIEPLSILLKKGTQTITLELKSKLGKSNIKIFDMTCMGA